MPSSDNNSSQAMDLDAQAYGVSSQYWASLSPQTRALYARVAPLPEAKYTIDVSLKGLEGYLASIKADCESIGGSFELCPDFQRGHVWTREQQQGYMEALYRGCAPMRLLMNCPEWTGEKRPGGDIPANTFQCVDGLQRLMAVLQFVRGEYGIFGGLKFAELAATPFDGRRIRMQISIMEISRRADLLSLYIRLNRGGTPHSDAEMARVQQLLAQAAQTAQDGQECEPASQTLPGSPGLPVDPLALAQEDVPAAREDLRFRPA